jgi:hypothetical protein
MRFELIWQRPAVEAFNDLQDAAERAGANPRRGKSSKQQGLFKQVVKCLDLLAENPRHPGLNTHAYSSLRHPYDPDDKVWGV